MHTHFASGLHTIGVFLSVVIVGTLWRLLAMHGLLSRSQTVRGLSKAMLVQFVLAAAVVALT